LWGFFVFKQEPNKQRLFFCGFNRIFVILHTLKKFKMATDNFQAHDYYLMDELLSDEHKLIRDTARAWVKKEVTPIVEEACQTTTFPKQWIKGLAEIGAFGPYIPTEYGGPGLDQISYGLIMQELERGDSGLRSTASVQSSLVMYPIYAYGSEEQKKKYLPKLASAEFIGAWGLTEPNTGSDAMRMKCVAKEDGDYWVLNGTKCWITHGITGDVAVVIARTGELLDSHGMTAFIVERGTPGFNAGKKENKLGMRASETAEMIFDNCRVPKSQVLGNVGDGFIQAMKILDGGRISIAALSLGIAKGAYDASIKFFK
jgi:alkylation response protein AidB-like acyl-CoA dehydrogenase